jgi:hypothetical protein
LKKLELEQRRQIKYQSTIDEWCKNMADELNELNFIHGNPNPAIEFIEKFAPPMPEYKKKLRSYKRKLIEDAPLLVKCHNSELTANVRNSNVWLKQNREYLHESKIKQASLINKLIEMEMDPKPINDVIKLCIDFLAN